MTSGGGTDDDVQDLISVLMCTHISEEYAVNKWNQALLLLG